MRKVSPGSRKSNTSLRETQGQPRAHSGHALQKPHNYVPRGFTGRPVDVFAQKDCDVFKAYCDSRFGPEFDGDIQAVVMIGSELRECRIVSPMYVAMMPGPTTVFDIKVSGNLQKGIGTNRIVAIETDLRAVKARNPKLFPRAGDEFLRNIFLRKVKLVTDATPTTPGMVFYTKLRMTNKLIYNPPAETYLRFVSFISGGFCTEME